MTAGRAGGVASDRELARRMAGGDRAALATAYEAWSGRVHTAVSRLAGADAPDVTHDAFMQAFERAGAYRGEGPLSAWIARIGVNLALQRLRRGRLARRFAERVAEPVTAAPAPADAVALDRAILALPDALRTVFVLHAVEGYPHEDVAAALGITEATSRQRLRRARLALIDSLDLERP